MSVRELILLSPYRFPSQNPLMLGSEDTAAFLQGFSALWHPAALKGASGPLRVGSPYDYEQPSAGHVYAVPETPPLVLPDDWDQRVREAGAVAFRATADRATTLANLKEALRAQADQAGTRAKLLDLEPAKVAPFFGIGFGHRMIETLFEAMEHENLLSTADFWQDIEAAVTALDDPDPEACRRHLQSAADRLLSAREVLYPVTIYLLDICLLDAQHLQNSLPGYFEKGIPLNLVAPAVLLETLRHDCPEKLASIKEHMRTDLLEVCGGPYVERDDALLPIESQLWNLLKGQAKYRELLDQEVRIFARKRFGAHPQLPLLLNSTGLRRSIFLAFDEAVLPSYQSTVVSLPSPDGKQIEAFTRMPHKADNPQTFFHWAHYLHRTIAQDHSATLALLHTGALVAPWYNDLMELSRFGSVLGQWMTLSRYLNEVTAGEYTTAGSPDDFRGDYLSDRTGAHSPEPVSWFARHARLRRRIDKVRTLAALSRGLAGRNDRLRTEASLDEMENTIETAGVDPGAALRVCEKMGTGSGRPSQDVEISDKWPVPVPIFSQTLSTIEKEAAQALAERLLARAADNTPGYLVLNPCSFTRRVALELEGIRNPFPVAGPVKASQIDGEIARLVVEVPALGFAWFPGAGVSDAPIPPGRMRLADAKNVRNEYFEAEIDPATGGLRALRELRTRTNRIGQQLVFNPGSTMRAKEVKVTSTGPALGEIVSEGTLVDEHGQVLAEFRQRYRAWLGRPVLELRIEIILRHRPQGYPWHAYYGARFAWRDERAALFRGVNGTGYLTHYTRPETPDYLEIRSGKMSTALFTGGLPFHQRHGARMLDVILVPEGEKAQTFDLGIGLDREYPMQTSLGMITPVSVIPTSKGPPHVGAAGWLFHLDSPNLLLTSLRPAPDGADAVIARLLECHNHAGQVELRCARNPRRAVLLDAKGESQMEANISGDAVLFEVAPGDLIHLRIEFE